MHTDGIFFKSQLYNILLLLPSLVLFPSLSCPSPSLLLLLHPLTLSSSSRGYFFHLHLAFSALLCPTQGESTSFQTQPYFSNTSWSLESTVRPHTLHRLLLCVCVWVCFCTRMYVHIFTMSEDWQDMQCHQEYIPTRCLEFQICLVDSFFFFLSLSVVEWSQLQVNY